MAATTIDTELFDGVRDVRPWLEDAIRDVELSPEEMNVPTDQLEDLGYI
jgi:hypothetical protein